MKIKNLTFFGAIFVILVGIFNIFPQKYAYSSEQIAYLCETNQNNKIIKDLCAFNINNEIIAQQLTQNMDSSNSNNQGTISGTIAYRERMALPSGAIVKIKLLDVSRADAPAVEIASQTITTTGEQVPIPFEITYDPSKIESKNLYSVRAEIFIADKLVFTTTQMYPVITQDKGNRVNMVLQRVGGRSKENSLEGSKWLLEDLAGKEVTEKVQTTLEFNENNQLSGNGGCNRYNASYKLKDSSFQVNAIASTFKMCPPPEMNQESAYFLALQKATSITIEGSSLLINAFGYDKPLKFKRY